MGEPLEIQAIKTGRLTMEILVNHPLCNFCKSPLPLFSAELMLLGLPW